MANAVGDGMTGMPFPKMRTRWVPAYMVPDYEGGIKRLRRDLHAIDIAWTHDGDRHSVKVAIIRDHPFLAALSAMPHVPRAVKAIYRKEVRVRHERTSDAFHVLRDLATADEAWMKYQRAAA